MAKNGRADNMVEAVNDGQAGSRVTLEYSLWKGRKGATRLRKSSRDSWIDQRDIVTWTDLSAAIDLGSRHFSWSWSLASINLVQDPEHLRKRATSLALSMRIAARSLQTMSIASGPPTEVLVSRGVVFGGLQFAW